MPEDRRESVLQLGRVGEPERLGDGTLQDVVYDILVGTGGRRGWHIVRTDAFAGGHLVIARRGADEIRAADPCFTTAAIAVMAEIARKSAGNVDTQLALPVELAGGRR